MVTPLSSPITIRFDHFHSRKFEGHPQYSYVEIFTRHTPNNTKQVFTRPSSITTDKTNTKNVIICTNNPVISKVIAPHFQCDTERHWFSVPKHMCELLQMDLILLMNTYCDIASKDQHWDVHYFIQQPIPEILFRSRLLLAYNNNKDGDDDIDMSHLP